MKFQAVCPNGQWVAGKPAAERAMQKFGTVGFSFETVERHGVQFVRTCPTEIEIGTLEELLMIIDRLEMPVTIDRNGVLIVDPS